MPAVRRVRYAHVDACCVRLPALLQDTIDERIASFSKLLAQVQGLDDVECGPLLKFLTDL